jgi:hypothetical protein
MPGTGHPGASSATWILPESAAYETQFFFDQVYPANQPLKPPRLPMATPPAADGKTQGNTATCHLEAR